MKKRILIAGASGMIGNEVLKLAFQSVEVSEIISLVRKESGNTNSKLKEVIVSDFSNYSDHASLFKNIDAAYFCIGVYTGQFSDEIFKKITVDYAVEFAKALAKESPNVRICLLSGQGADRTEKSKASFAKYKGMAENRISDLGLSFHSLRPGYIYPVTPRKEPNLMYKIMRVCYPFFKLFGDKFSVKSTDLAKALFLIGLHGTDKEIIENKEIINFIEKRE